jgi:hypothetical protein
MKRTPEILGLKELEVARASRSVGHAHNFIRLERLSIRGDGMKHK